MKLYYFHLAQFSVLQNKLTNYVALLKTWIEQLPCYFDHCSPVRHGRCVVGGLTHWGRVTHICISKLTMIGSDNGLSPGRRQAIIWTNAWVLLIRTLETKFSEILSEVKIFYSRKSIWKCRLKKGGHIFSASMFSNESAWLVSRVAPFQAHRLGFGCGCNGKQSHLSNEHALFCCMHICSVQIYIGNVCDRCYKNIIVLCLGYNHNDNMVEVRKVMTRILRAQRVWWL